MIGAADESRGETALAFVEINEGDELEALKGAKVFVEKHKPYMAIYVYNKMKDILEIPEYIYSVSRDYTFFLRGGGHTVLYAIPNR